MSTVFRNFPFLRSLQGYGSGDAVIAGFQDSEAQAGRGEGHWEPPAYRSNRYRCCPEAELAALTCGGVLDTGEGGRGRRRGLAWQGQGGGVRELRLPNFERSRVSSPYPACNVGAGSGRIRVVRVGCWAVHVQSRARLPGALECEVDGLETREQI